MRLRLETAGAGLRPARGPGPDQPAGGRPAGHLPPLDRGQRLPEAERKEFTPTAKQMLYGKRAELDAHRGDRREGRRGRSWPGRGRDAGLARRAAGRKGLRLRRRSDQPLEDGQDSTRWTRMPERLVRALVRRRWSRGCAGASPTPSMTGWPAPARPRHRPEAALPGQARFLAGLDAFHAAGAPARLRDEQAGVHRQLRQDPDPAGPGSAGHRKSYSTAFALFARLQGAMPAGQDFRVFVSLQDARGHRRPAGERA